MQPLLSPCVASLTVRHTLAAAGRFCIALDSAYTHAAAPDAVRGQSVALQLQQLVGFINKYPASNDIKRMRQLHVAVREYHYSNIKKPDKLTSRMLRLMSPCEIHIHVLLPLPTRQGLISWFPN